jgi:hypothetical protein
VNVNILKKSLGHPFPFHSEKGNGESGFLFQSQSTTRFTYRCSNTPKETHTLLQMPYVPYRTVRDKTSQKLRGSIYELPRSNVFNRRLLPAAEDGLIAYGSFSSTVTQPVTAGTPLALTYDTKDLTTTPYVTVVLSPASSQITVSLNGIYTVLTSIQVDQTTALNDLEFYVSVNGTAVANSGSRLALTASVEDVFTVEWMLELFAGDSVEVYLSSASAGFRALAIAASAPVPLIPSVITNIKRIANYNPTLIITTTGAPLVTISGGRTYYTFNNDGSFQNNIPISSSVDYVAIAGGGGGGFDAAGGGGAGGLQQGTGQTLPTGTYSVTIGAGGVGGVTASRNGGKGGDTLFGVLVTAEGGGSGGQAVSGPGGAGGCGGGAGWNNTTIGTGSQGFNGGSGLYAGVNLGGGGGGGVATVGGNGTPSGGGSGGGGITYNNGTTLQLGGGGGGGGQGAAGGTATFGGGAGGTSTSGANGGINTGGGGGGGWNSQNGGAGGKGIFIISYLG